MSDTSARVSATVEAPVGVVFDLLATPHRHHEMDGSGMVGADEFDEPITKVGQVFRMNMTRSGADGSVEYQTDNHVTKFKPNRKIAWKVAPVDGEPLGWMWRWDLSPKGKNDQKTLVTLTYEWGETSEANLKKYGVPMFDQDDLARSLELLGKAVRRS